jgi:uncharacterized protein YgiM (DUF1202 family)
MLTRTIKTVALAAAVVVATAGASMAATWAWVDHDAKVRKNHSNSSSTVNWVEEGQKVKVIAQWNNWFKIQIPGPDGWVRYNVLDFGGYDDDDFYPGPGFGSQFCVKGKNAQFCLGAQY